MVKMGKLSRKNDEETLVRLLFARRDKSVAEYPTRYAPPARFRVVRRKKGDATQSLCFDDLAVRHRAVNPRRVLYKMRSIGGEQLMYLQKMASLGELMAGIAHEIKTPVGAISSMHDTLNRSVLKLKKNMGEAYPGFEENRRIAGPLRILEEAQRVIGSGSERTLEIVRRVHKFARMDTDRMAEADLHAELDDTVMLAHNLVKNRIEVVRSYGDIPKVTCSVGQINQVLLNLLVNASQAIDGQGTITITTAAEGDGVRVSVSDTGCGIPAEQLGRIFTPGFSTKADRGGTGLGLAISSRVINEHGGRIDVDSEVGKGATVSVFLPVTPSA